MKKVLTVALLTLGIGACGSGSTSTPQVQKAEKIVQACLPRGNVTTQGGRQKILRCLAPPGHEAAFEHCVLPYLKVTNFTLHHRRLYEGVATCLENNR